MILSPYYSDIESVAVERLCWPLSEGSGAVGELKAACTAVEAVIVVVRWKHGIT